MDAISHDDTLPEVSEETIGRMEARVFEAIREERRPPRTARARRRRLWQGVGLAAAIVAVAAVISPAVLGGLAGEGATDAADGGGAQSAPGVVPERAPGPAEDAQGGGADGTTAGGSPTDVAAPSEGRDIIRTGTATIVVDDASAAVEEIVGLAADHQGWVQLQSVGADGSVVGPEQTDDMSVWVPEDGGFVSIRIPSDTLDAVMADLDEVGEVTSRRVSAEDVTTTAIDLRARIEAAQASVSRLTDLLAQAGDVADLVQVETTLSQRQAELESLQQQLASLEGQVAMSTLSVSLVTEAPPVKADPAGFGDGLAAGWDGLLATLNGIVIALGFLLPWLGVAAVILLLLWGVRRATRRSRRARVTESSGTTQGP
ncbi:DUF4349 domain-containing protein [Microbacterium phosphatis]|uniref:DUF4349 domain-containing protein n=1 Tax=Microbacterium phosphatis TaxID=3140248 RepID=UPI0031405797